MYAVKSSFLDMSASVDTLGIAYIARLKAGVLAIKYDKKVVRWLLTTWFLLRQICRFDSKRVLL